MSVYDKSIKNVAEAAAKIMGEAKKPLHPNQQKLDVHEPEKDELTSKDFEMLRAGKKAKMKEDVQQIDELKKSTLGSYAKKATTDAVHKTQDAEAEAEYGSPFKSRELEKKAEKRVAGVHKAVSRLTKEDVELQEMKDMIDALILEYESKGGVYKHKGTYGTAKGAEYGETDYDKENEMEKKKDKPARKAYGARQNYVRSTRVNEGFISILDKYNEGGLQTLFTLVEEPDSEQFADELKKQERKAAGNATDSEKAKVAAPATQGVKSMPEEVEQVEERQMTEPEMKEREKIVKGMKKGIAGFKQRYGERAKSVMYATATKQAMKD
jgi:hypothetical protein